MHCVFGLSVNPAHLSVLVLVEGQSIGAVLVVIHAVLALLTQLEVLGQAALHHHIFAHADAGDVPLSIHYQNLQM